MPSERQCGHHLAGRSGCRQLAGDYCSEALVSRQPGRDLVEDGRHRRPGLGRDLPGLGQLAQSAVSTPLRLPLPDPDRVTAELEHVRSLAQHRHLARSGRQGLGGHQADPQVRGQQRAAPGHLLSGPLLRSSGRALSEKPAHGEADGRRGRRQHCAARSTEDSGPMIPPETTASRPTQRVTPPIRDRLASRAGPVRARRFRSGGGGMPHHTASSTHARQTLINIGAAVPPAGSHPDREGCGRPW